MIQHTEITNKELRKKIRNSSTPLAGNTNLKIYGKLSCRSGKRMKKENRVFFGSQTEAIELGFRPCGHCLRIEYKNWRNGSFHKHSIQLY